MCLKSINSYRAKHVSTLPLQWDNELATKADAYAQVLLTETLRRGKLYFEHDPANELTPEMGENLWYANGWPAGDLGFYCHKADVSW